MGAVIVQCPSCQARFHLAQERIPEKGARVRCSRCEHRFYVTSTGDVSQSKPRKKASDGESGREAQASSGSASGSDSSLELSASGAASQQPRAPKTREAATTAMEALREPAKPARARSLGAVAPQEDADLDDPQFLFDESSSSVELPYTPGALGPEDEEPSSAALGDVTGRARAVRAPDTDVTPQAPAEPAAAPAAPATDPQETSGSWLSNDDAAIPDIRAQKDELDAQASPLALSEGSVEGFELTGSQTPERAAEPAPQPRSSPQPRVEAPRSAPRKPAEPESAPGRYAGAGDAMLVQRSVPERPRESAPAVEGPLASSLARVGTLVSAFMAVVLIFAGAQALLVQLRVPEGPERVALARGEVSSVEVLHLHDAEGNRVLAVRGLLSSASGELPRVQLQLLDAKRRAVGSPYRARPELLRDSDLATEKLAGLLAPGEERSPASEQRGFTVLIREPPLEAESFTLELAS